ncbi:MAG: hypothetical protein JWO47_422 [Candidatus Saccharibacteria bacterium]|nr:hypothetical protein [Candidatus Saccharibacteria bacterium]
MDVVLLVAAVITIIGLATFVRLHTTKAPDDAAKQSTMAINTEHMDTLSLDNGSEAIATTPSSSGVGANSQVVGPASSSASSQLQSAMTAPEASSPASACAKSCDDTKLTAPAPKVDTNLVTVQPVTTCGGLAGKVVNSLLNERPECLLN